MQMEMTTEWPIETTNVPRLVLTTLSSILLMAKYRMEISSSKYGHWKEELSNHKSSAWDFGSNKTN